jgi:glycosyltransferase involved in cell wall biosynthesis
MKLLVFSHKKVWKSELSELGYATDGGFAHHMFGLSLSFDEVKVVVPEALNADRKGEVQFYGKNLKIKAINDIKAKGILRKILFFPYLLINFFRFLSLIRKYDVIHSPIPSDLGTLGFLLAYYLDKPLIIRHCGNWENQRTLAEKFWRKFMTFNAGGSNLFMTTGWQKLKPSFENHSIDWIFSTSLTQENISYLQNTPKRDVSGKINLLHVARQEKEKGADTVIESLKELDNIFELTIVGNGDYLENLKQKVKDFDISNRVTFTGKVSQQEVVEFCKKSHIFVYPTRASEGFPKVVLESMATGLPVISTNVSIIPRLLEKGAGLLVKPSNPNELVIAINDIIADEDRYCAISQRCKDIVKDYTLESWGNEFIKRLENQMNGI